MCGGKQPKAPDPVATANAQAGYSEKAARTAAAINAVNQYGPYGSTTFQRAADGTPTSQTVTLSPEMQRWLDSQFNSSTKLQDATSRQLDYLPTDQFQLPSDTSADEYSRQAFGDAVLDPSNFDTSKIAAASYEQAKSQFQPDIDAAKKEAEIRLSQRGINPGDEIWETEMGRLDRQANNAYTGAARQAGLDAGNEQTRAIGNAVTARNYGGNTYQQNLSNQLLERNQPFSEAAALMGTTPSFQTPSFMNTSAQSIASPDYQGGVWNSYNAQAQQAAAKNNALGNILSTVAGTATKAAFASDERLKEEREPADGEGILAALREIPVDDYRYRDEAQGILGVPEHRTGPMAQDWAEEFGGDGQTIDMPDVLGKLLAAIKALDKRTHEMGEGEMGESA